MGKTLKGVKPLLKSRTLRLEADLRLTRLSLRLIRPGFCLVQANIGWGAECQAYKMSVRAETAHLPSSKPTFKANLNWSVIPESMAKFGRR